MTTEKQVWTIIDLAGEFIPETEIIIEGDEFHYLANVLRLKVGDEIEINNCQGIKASAKVIMITKKEAKCLILQRYQMQKMYPEIHLYLALPKPSTLEEIVASVSEMGLDEIHIFRTAKCSSKAPVKLEKIQRIANEAVRISKSAYSAKVFSYENMSDFYKKRRTDLENGLNLFCDESDFGANKIMNLLLEEFTQKKDIHLIIGPEASFSSVERDFIYKSFNCFPVLLGNNILRVPTAVYSALALALQARDYLFSPSKVSKLL